MLGGRHVPHYEHCIFHRTRAGRRDERLWNRPPRKAPEGYFGVLRDRAEEQRVSQPGGRSEEDGERTGVRRSAMSQRLLMLSVRTGLNRLPQAGPCAGSSGCERLAGGPQAAGVPLLTGIRSFNPWRSKLGGGMVGRLLQQTRRLRAPISPAGRTIPRLRRTDTLTVKVRSRRDGTDLNRLAVVD